MQIIQNSLFPSEERFNKDHFVSFIESSKLPILISDAIIKSFDKVYGFKDLEERRVKSDMMNSVTFSTLKNKLLEEGIVTMNDCIDSSAGNIKKHFYAGDYIFILWMQSK